MGVPTFFRWLCTRYPKTIRDAVEKELIEKDGRFVPIDINEENPNGGFDCLYLDMNAIIHPCSHPEEGKPPKNEGEMFELIFLYIDRIIRIVRPNKLLYMAVDGCAPRAKMNQQRARRFRAAQERDEQAAEKEKLKAEWEAEGRKLPPKQALAAAFDSNVITPGTKFMWDLNEAIKYYIHERTNFDPLWQKLRFRVILSDCQIPGEGEHKLMDFIRIQRAQPEYDPNTRHCIYGADADLIHLALASHETHFHIIREVVLPKEEKKQDPWEQFEADEEEAEEVAKAKPFQFINIGVLRQYLYFEFEPLRDKLPFPYNFERCVDDFVFFCFFVGNDFLPHLPSLNIRDGSIDMMILLYLETLPKLGDYLTDAGTLNLETTEKFLEDLGSVEDQVFKNRLAREAKQKQEFDEARDGGKGLEELEKNVEDDEEEAKIERIKREKRDKELQEKKTKGESAKGMAEGKKKKKIVRKKKGIEVKKDADKKEASEKKDEKASPKNSPKQAAKKVDVTAAADQLAALFDNEAESSSEEEVEVTDDEASDAEKPKEKPSPMAKPVVNSKRREEKMEEAFLKQVRNRLNDKKDFGQAMKDTIRLGEGAHWKRRYYAEKFKVEQEDLVDFLQRIRKAYIEGLCWVLKYYYQGVVSWTWFYPYHYAPFGSDLIGMSSLKCSDEKYFALGKGFEPVQQLMAVLPPVSAKVAGIPQAMMTLMEEHDSPIADFFPTDFGLDLNGKRFAWQGVVLLPFIDEPRLLRILAPMMTQLQGDEKKRNNPSINCLFGHVSDLKKKVPPKGSTNKRLLRDAFLFGFVQGQFGTGEEIPSPIEGLAEVDESECVETKYYFPDRVTHSIELLENATFEPQVVDQSDLDDMQRLKGFGGMTAKKVIQQALGLFKGKSGKKGGKKGGGKKGDKGGGKKGKGKMAMPQADQGPRRPPARSGPY
ncbi:unnamed protein product [Amoebophrya sp. A120]|nr:unnamed protein product [Amoebophrya sp. A120]|eukprot:GSA120T00010609001.1